MATFNFSALQVTVDRTTEYTIHEIDFAPTLVLAPATEENKPYFNAVLKRSRKTAQAIAAGKMSAAILKESRTDDRELFPKYILKDWKDNMQDANGEAVPFSKDAAKDFLDALPDWLFDKVRNHSGNQHNFVEDGDELMDPEDRAGN